MRNFIGILLIALGACAGPEAVVGAGARYAPTPAVGEEYQINFDDRVRVSVFRDTALSGEFQVSSSGTLPLPLLGEVQVAGHSAREVQQTIQAKLASGYIKDPHVSVEVLTFRSVYIIGEVKTPGKYPYTTGLTALNAIASAGGFTPRSEQRVVRIRDADSATEQSYRLLPALKVLPGDTLRVGERLF